LLAAEREHVGDALDAVHQPRLHLAARADEAPPRPGGEPSRERRSQEATSRGRRDSAIRRTRQECGGLQQDPEAHAAPLGGEQAASVSC